MEIINEDAGEDEDDTASDCGRVVLEMDVHARAVTTIVGDIEAKPEEGETFEVVKFDDEDNEEDEGTMNDDEAGDETVDKADHNNPEVVALDVLDVRLIVFSTRLPNVVVVVAVSVVVVAVRSTIDGVTESSVA